MVGVIRVKSCCCPKKRHYSRKLAHFAWSQNQRGHVMSGLMCGGVETETIQEQQRKQEPSS
uniref:Uncharacterized protein n=1 Tax=Arundo donax TaxID=35708 RepID=A0A0A9ERD0_ARUDO